MNEFLTLSDSENNAIARGDYDALAAAIRSKEALLHRHHNQIDGATAHHIKLQSRRLNALIPVLKTLLYKKIELEKLRRFVIAYDRSGVKNEIPIE